MTTYLRADRAVFRFSGVDAHKLLNDVVTGHIPTQGDGTDEAGVAWALLSPQGKILAEGLAGYAGDAIWLDVHHSVADDFFKRMKMYRLRAQVVIDDLRETHRVGFATEQDPAAISHLDRLGPVKLGWRQIAPVEAISGWVADDTAYHEQRIAAGILHQGNDFAANDAFAHDIGLDLLEGIDFAKGCYVGQEVVSRMKHRGTARRRPVIVDGVDAPSGSAVLAGDREAGRLGQVVNGRALAIIRLDRISDPEAASVEGKPVRLSLPAFASYAFGESTPDE
ncbi:MULTISPECIES: folate-binding protein YgfZ [unclassified Devosia]|uniref:CAF17-like 4Fe-4S cluster assembly/insertion protein YgfZ n=1 Tax=unclassified Devosia TaxID=196773 RepID=UPI001552EE7F|nr:MULTISPECIES: folate-binding protein YgfZ [unclassified Devosia]